MVTSELQLRLLKSYQTIQPRRPREDFKVRWFFGDVSPGAPRGFDNLTSQVVAPIN